MHSRSQNEKGFTPASNNPFRLLNSKPHNSETLQRVTMKELCEQIPEINSLLSALNTREFFNVQGQVPSGKMLDYLQRVLKLNIAAFDKSASALVHEDLIFNNEHDGLFLPDDCLPLKEKFEYYIDVLCDVLNNKLADQNYEANLPDKENVSEREHALQAGKIAFLFGMSESDILAMLFHDISRPTHEDPIHGNRCHCDEGSQILKPLGLSIDYSLVHAFAKYLLVEFNSVYRTELLSPVSTNSLQDQVGKFKSQLASLPAFAANELPCFIFKIMFMRIIDDFGKVPTMESKKEINYFSMPTIKRMLSKQISMRLNDLVTVCDNVDETVDRVRQELDAALVILERPKQFSKNPSLYLSQTTTRLSPGS